MEEFGIMKGILFGFVRNEEFSRFEMWYGAWHSMAMVRWYEDGYNLFFFSHSSLVRLTEPYSI